MATPLLDKYQKMYQEAEQITNYADHVLRLTYHQSVEDTIADEKGVSFDKLNDTTTRNTFKETLVNKLLEAMKKTKRLPSGLNMDFIASATTLEEKLRGLDIFTGHVLGVDATTLLAMVEQFKGKAGSETAKVYHSHAFKYANAGLSKYQMRAEQVLKDEEGNMRDAVIAEAKDLVEPDALPLLEKKGYAFPIVINLHEMYKTQNKGATTPQKVSKKDVKELIKSINKAEHS